MQDFACMIMLLGALLNVPHSICISCLCDFNLTSAENSGIQLCFLFFGGVLLCTST